MQRAMRVSMQFLNRSKVARNHDHVIVLAPIRFDPATLREIWDWLEPDISTDGGEEDKQPYSSAWSVSWDNILLI